MFCPVYLVNACVFQRALYRGVFLFLVLHLVRLFEFPTGKVTGWRVFISLAGFEFSVYG